MKEPGPFPPDPNVFVTAACGRRCLYCSAEGEDRGMTPAQIRAVLRRGHRSLVFEGGEPLLCAGLERWVKAAAASGTGDITVLTNGLALTPERRASLTRAGVAHFHFNFPSHLERVYDLLTGTRGRFAAQVAAMKGAAAQGPEAAALVCVVNSVNYRLLPAYVSYAARELPGLFYIAFNFIKVKGLVKKNKWLVPRLGEVRPFLLKALARARELGVPCLADGFPLCFMKGFEAYSSDADRLLKGDRTYLREKARVKACEGCGLAGVCAGPRADYVSLYGGDGFKPAPRGAAAAVARHVRAGQLALNRPARMPQKRRTPRGKKKDI